VASDNKGGQGKLIAMGRNSLSGSDVDCGGEGNCSDVDPEPEDEDGATVNTVTESPRRKKSNRQALKRLPRNMKKRNLTKGHTFEKVVVCDDRAKPKLNVAARARVVACPKKHSGKSFVGQVLRAHPNLPMAIEQVGAHAEKENIVSSTSRTASTAHTLLELQGKLQATDQQLGKLKATRECKQAIVETKRDHKQAMEKADREHKLDKMKAINSMQEEHKAKGEEYTAAIEAKDAEHVAALSAKEVEYAAGIAAKDLHIAAAVAWRRTMELEFKTALKQKQERYNRVFVELRQSAMDALQRMKQEHEVELSELKAAMSTSAESLQLAHEYLSEIEATPTKGANKGGAPGRGNWSAAPSACQAAQLIEYEQNRCFNTKTIDASSTNVV
jgi:hypothetical protein